MTINPAQMIVDHFYNAYNNTKLGKENPLIGLALDLHYSASVSNTHCRPKNGVTNWAGLELDENGNLRPTGYPGFAGRIWFRIEKPSSHESMVMASLGMHTGTGGFGSYEGEWKGVSRLAYELYVQKKLKYNAQPNVYSYDVKIFKDDIPEIMEQIYKLELFRTIKDNSSSLAYKSYGKIISSRSYDLDDEIISIAREHELIEV